MTNTAFVEDVKGPSFRTQLLDRFERVSRTLHFCILLRVNALCTEVRDLEQTYCFETEPFQHLQQ